MKLFCDCMKDATVRSVHAVTAIGNSQGRKRRAANRAMAATSHAVSVKDPDMSLDDDDETGDIVHGSKSWKLPLDIMKADADQHLIFGWASVIEKDGKIIIDKQGDIIPVEELENAAYEFTLNSRDGGDMHHRTGVAKLVESMVFTKEKQNALGIDIGQVGWWVGFKVHDADLWSAHKRGERPEFSIGGAAIPYEVDDNIFKRGGRHLTTRFPFDAGAASAIHHTLSRLFAHQCSNLLHEYTNQTVYKASDRVSHIIRVLDEDDDMLKNSTAAIVNHLTRAAERTGAHATEQLIGSGERLLRQEEQARLRAMHSSLQDNVAFWTRKYGKERAAELVGRMYDKKGELVVKPDAQWNINATTNEIAAKLVSKALNENWSVAKLSDKLRKTGLFDPGRAELIARTEINTAQNLAMLKAGYKYQQETRTKLHKIILLGPNPCAICEENAEEELGLDEEFTNGGFAPTFHPRCMCELQLIEA